ncbi:MAG: hypothetical protein JST00_11105 [Deltaproteobacteria bacterium]|nr:hypothetical protein [Deltaproteobacteria bacterium]
MRKLRFALPFVAAGLALAASATKPVRAEDDAAEKRERCATRLSIALLGKSAAPALLAAANPQDSVDAMLADPAFVDRFASFTNRRFNPEPGGKVAEDASYTLAKYILENKKPWKDLFVGAYDVADTVTTDAGGLGYFRSDAWMRRYAGNELAGYRLPAAYRILQNTTGLQLMPTTNADGVDISATGRQAPACRGCHYENWYALDKVARVLSRRQGTGNAMKFVAPSDGPQSILGGKTINDDAQLVNALVGTEEFKVNACKMAFQYLYGREENSCEAQVFDRCVDAFTKDQTMQAAVAVVAKDPTFCQ